MAAVRRAAVRRVLAAAAVVGVVVTGTSAGGSLLTREEVVVERMQNITVAVAREAKITCHIANLADYKVAWIQRNGAAVLAVQTDRIAPDPRIRVSHENRRAWHLHIEHVRREDQGWYTCQVNTRNVTEQHAFLEVTVPPDISNERSSGEVKAFEGDNVTLICHASGTPQPNITWRRENELPLPFSSAKPVLTSEGARLELGRVDRSFTSDYFCIASNGWPPAVSKRVQLRVNFKPEVHAARRVIRVRAGANVTLACRSEAYPAGMHYWTRLPPRTARWQQTPRYRAQHGTGHVSAHRSWTGSDYPSDVIQAGGRFALSVTPERVVYQHRMALKVSRIGREDFGVYQCVNQNHMGKAFAETAVLEGGKRPPERPWRQPELSITTVSERVTGVTLSRPAPDRTTAVASDGAQFTEPVSTAAAEWDNSACQRPSLNFKEVGAVS